MDVNSNITGVYAQPALTIMAPGERDEQHGFATRNGRTMADNAPEAMLPSSSTRLCPRG